ncbi:MAG TPA: methyltransferase domain-containing protein [Candidatus Polarisedimenticolia bacterium]|nr:methyltransferase domain-containing protein [Candidatus Polarisedimenticolia bacterium]
MAAGRSSIVQERFRRQARAFARSPLQRDPGRLRRLVAFSGARAGEKALDAACGPGIVTAALRDQGLFAVGVDLTRAMLREAARAGGPYVRGDLERLPFRAAAFDLLICRSTFHHLPDPGRVLREMVRVVRRGGRVVIEDMRAPDDPAQRKYHETIERLRDRAHARALTLGELRSLAEEAGLSEIREERIAFVIDFGEWMQRAYPPPADRKRARAMMEACLKDDLCGLRVWREGARLKFERRSMLLRGVGRRGARGESDATSG